MRVASLKWRFTAQLVRQIPDVQGVFTLWNGKECVYVGSTPGNASLRDCLREHLVALHDGLIEATHFTWESTAMPRSREEELRARLARRQGKVPRYNRPGSPLRPRIEPITDLRGRP